MFYDLGSSGCYVINIIFVFQIVSATSESDEDHSKIVGFEHEHHFIWFFFPNICKDIFLNKKITKNFVDFFS